LRGEAVLAIVMVTNEDDCSVRSDSLLLDPDSNSVTDMRGLGALQSYRCNEFGHLCDGQPPPHNPPAQTVTLNNCVSAEDSAMAKNDDLVTDPSGHGDPTHGHLWPTVREFSDTLRLYKANPDDILVAAIAGPTADNNGGSLYRVKGEVNAAAMGETDPVVDHSCTQATSDPNAPEYADPAVRIKQWIDDFGANGVFYPICANDFSTAMVGIAKKIHQKLGASCVSTNVAYNTPGDPASGHNCQVTQKITDSGGTVTTARLDECDGTGATVGNAPCYQLLLNNAQCTDPTAKTLFKVCNDNGYTAMMGSTDTKDASIACAVM